MPVVSLDDLPGTGPLIGLDPGSRTVGVAACDALRLIASPVETVPRGKKASPTLNRILDICREKSAVGLVIGLPLNMSGEEGPRAQSARALARNLLKLSDMPITFQDERLTSAEAERAMIEADLSRARRAELIDASAAALILQTAIDRLANSL
ncbi:MAG: Holliday junction resolvase RuvX [Pseudomonadota bacterium]